MESDSDSENLDDIESGQSQYCINKPQVLSQV